MDFTQDLKNRIINGYLPDEKDAMAIAGEDTAVLAKAANEIRLHFCKNRFGLCAIINAKSGGCHEDCKFCAQSCRYGGPAEEYGLLDPEKICKSAVQSCKNGVSRFSFVTSGRRLSDMEIDTECEACRLIRKECSISLCASNGLLNQKQLEKLHAAGITRYHCNLETSREFFPNICKTHTYGDKIKTIEAAYRSGMEICSGGIIGLGETMRDRVRLAVTLRSLHAASVPINVLNPIPGTPLEHNKRLTYDEVCKTVSIFRFLLPSASIRMAGGRALLPDKGARAVRSGLNALITGDMLTTKGITPAEDRNMAENMGFVIEH